MLTHARVLLVSREGRDLETLTQLLASAGHDVAGPASVEKAVLRLGQGEADIVVLSSPDGGLHGLEQLTAAASMTAGVNVILLADGLAGGQVRDALRMGASDVVERAAGDDALLVAVERATRAQQMLCEVAMLRARVGDETQHALVGRSSSIVRVRELVGRAAASPVAVVISGEAGTGKDAVARLVHDLSDRAPRPYVTVRCGGADAEALELELFGRAASDGIAARSGLLEEARGGTVVLDEASLLPSALRAQLARVATTRSTRRIGSDVSIPADVRLILIARGSLDSADTGASEELLRRFNAMLIAIPPLRERRSDIPQLVQHFRRRLATEQGIDLAPLSPDEMLPLLGHEWSGNVRELEHWVERAALASSNDRPGSGGVAEVGGVDLGAARVTLEQLERAYILHVLEQESGHQSRAATRLGIDRRTLYRKLKQYRTEPVELQKAG